MASEHFFITGGTGFLGIHITRVLLARGQQVTLFDLLPLEEKDQDLEGKVRMVIGDVRDPEVVARASEGVNVIVHAAASLPIKRDDAEIMAVNVKGTENVMEAAKKNGVRKVVFISSTAVYGVPRFHPIEETTPLVPLGPYGESKFAAEQVCEKYRAQGVDITIIRPKTFLGAERLGLFQILFEWIRNGYGIYTIGNGKNRYQLLAVTDLVEAIWLAATKPNVNETFNVGAEEFVSSKDELNAVGEHAGTGSRVVTTPAWLVKAVLQVLEWLRLSPLSAWHYKTADKDSFVSIEKAKRVLGWQPQKSNTQTLIEGYDWYAANWQKYVNRMGTNHRVSWDQKFLKYFARKMK
jgi:nucleoside-diphosphate-sugar epimerase